MAPKGRRIFYYFFNKKVQFSAEVLYRFSQNTILPILKTTTPLIKNDMV